MTRTSVVRLAACSAWLLVVGCDSTTASTSLLRVDALAADATCPSGGSAVKTGIDKNNNGTLDDSEVTSTQEICNGASASGTTGTLTAIDASVGTHCANGGTRIQSGPDTNGNGILDADEVKDTSYVCDQLPQGAYHLGSVSIHDATELAAVQAYSIVIGDVTVQPTFAGTFSWPSLTQITGGFLVGGVGNSGNVDLQLANLANVQYIDIEAHPAITTVALDAISHASAITVSNLPKLTTVSFGKWDAGSIRIENDPLLTSVSFPKLTTLDAVSLQGDPLLATVSLPAKGTLLNLNVQNMDALTTLTLDGITTFGSLQINNTALLTTLSFPNLTSITGNSSIGAQALTSISMPKLATIVGPDGALAINSCYALTTVSLPVLTSAQSLTFQFNDLLTSISLPLLATVTSLTIQFNNALPSVSLPLLTSATTLSLQINGALTSFSLPLLTSAMNVYIENNSQLPTCAVVDKIVSVLGSGGLTDWAYDGNDTTVACTPTEFCAAKTFGGLTGTFHVCIDRTDWNSAEAACAARYTAGALATFDTLADWKTFKAALIAAKVTQGWLGYTDAVTEGTWLPPTGITAAYHPATNDVAFWNAGEPNNSGGAENCAQIVDGTALVNDANCGNGLAFICRN